MSKSNGGDSNDIPTTSATDMDSGLAPKVMETIAKSCDSAVPLAQARPSALVSCTAFEHGNSGKPYTETLPTIATIPSSSLTRSGQDHERLVAHDTTQHSPSRQASVRTTPTSSHAKDNLAFMSSKDASDLEKLAVEENAKNTIELEDEVEDATDTSPFPKELSPFRLARLVDPKSLATLKLLGGTEGILQGLGTDAKHGLRFSSSKCSPSSPFPVSVEDRQRVYGQNILPSRKSKTLLQLMWITLKDKVLVLLSVAAVVSLALGLLQDFGTRRETYTCGNGQTCTLPPVDWVEGVAIMVAVTIVVVFGSLNDWQKEKQFKALNDKKEDRTVKVIRDSNEMVINVKDLIVGDVALVEPGEVAPCDGVFLSGYNVKCDESAVTGESDAIRKVPYAECVAAEANGQLSSHTDCFILSGSKVLEGVGRYVVIAIGVRSFNGRIMMALRTENESTPLQTNLTYLTKLITKLASLAGLLLFVGLLIRFFVELGTGEPERSSNEKGLIFVDILIISVSLIVVAVPEGLPLAVTLALAFATKRMTEENLLVRVLASCETMANTTVVCTDKTGTLTQNEMTVVAGSVGIRTKFARRLIENKARTGASDEHGSFDSERKTERRGSLLDGSSIDQAELDSILSPTLKRCFNEAICVNSTAFEDVNQKTGERVFVGSKTETAMLRFVKEMGWPDYQETRDNAEVVQMIPFSSERKAMGVVVKIQEGHWRLYLKGASEILTEKCVRTVVVRRPDEAVKGEGNDDVEAEDIDAIARDKISRTIDLYADQMLRTIALCYRDLYSWPPKGLDTADSDEVPYDAFASDLTLIGIVAIEDPLREGVRKAVGQCLKAGVQVKMCTGDNVLTARSIASQCGILTPGGVVMEGLAFRQLNDREILEVVPRLQVLARSSPEDKKLLVEKLKELGEIVGVTGDGTNDGPALKTAHVGFSMGIAGTEVAKEASDIILMDDNFASIVKAIMWGRCVNDAVRKFLQFQISVNITAVMITYATALPQSQNDSALTAVQLLWINIIMDTFAALALATDPASPSLLDRRPDRKSAPMFNVDMYKQIFGQSLYQTIVILVFHFVGGEIFGFRPDPNDQNMQIENRTKLKTLVFNAFVFAQIFNSVNSRRIDSKKNVFEGIHQNWYFITITLLEVVIQILIIFFGGNAFSVTEISGKFWGVSLALGFMSIPIGFLIRCVPNPPIERFFYMIRLMSDPSVLPTERPNADEAVNLNNVPFGLLRDPLKVFKTFGRRDAAEKESNRKIKLRIRQDEDVKTPDIRPVASALTVNSTGPGRAYRNGVVATPNQSDAGEKRRVSTSSAPRAEPLCNVTQGDCAQAKQDENE